MPKLSLFKSIVVSIGTLMLTSLASALSFAGNDWLFSHDAVFHVRTGLGNSDIPSFSAGDPVDVSQSVVDQFSFPFAFGGLSGQGDFVVTGTTVTDINSGQTSDPFDVLVGSTVQTVRITYPTWLMTGTVTGINSAVTGSFGDRAFAIDGDSVTINNVKIEMLLAGNWLDLGSQSSIDVNDWAMNRESVPEPISLLILGGVSALALRRRTKV